MGTMYQLGYVRQLDMGSLQRAAQRELPHIGPDYTAPRTPSVTPSFAGKYCTDKESMTRLTSVPLHKQKPKLLGSVSLPYAKKKKRKTKKGKSSSHLASLAEMFMGKSSTKKQPKKKGRKKKESLVAYVNKFIKPLLNKYQVDGSEIITGGGKEVDKNIRLLGVDIPEAIVKKTSVQRLLRKIKKTKYKRKGDV